MFRWIVELFRIADCWFSRVDSVSTKSCTLLKEKRCNLLLHPSAICNVIGFWDLTTSNTSRHQTNQMNQDNWSIKENQTKITRIPFDNNCNLRRKVRKVMKTLNYFYFYSSISSFAFSSLFYCILLCFSFHSLSFVFTHLFSFQFPTILFRLAFIWLSLPFPFLPFNSFSSLFLLPKLITLTSYNV
jgi:hypothetical protein